MIPSPLLFIHESAANGGAERALLQLLDTLRDAGVEADLLLLEPSGVLSEDFARHHPLKERSNPFRKLYGFSGRFYSLRKLLLRQRLKHFDFRKDYAAAIGFMEGTTLLAQTRLPFRAHLNIGWVHCDLLRHHWTSFAFSSENEERRAYARLDGVACVSETVREAFLRWFGGTTTALVVPNLLPLDRIEAAGNGRPAGLLHPSSPRLCWIGRMMPEKNPLLAVEAVATLERRHGIRAELTLAGDGPLLPEVRVTARKLGCSDRIHTPGYIADPYPLMAASDALLATSPSEGSHLSVAEAMLLGVPVIATRNPAAEQWLMPDRGILIDPTSDSLADNLAAALADPARAQVAAVRARVFARHSIGPRRTLDALADLFEAAKESAVEKKC